MLPFAPMKITDNDHLYSPSSFRNFLDSGHGGQTPDLDGDEVDGLDEGRSLIHRFAFPPPDLQCGVP
jgi:hypothetical protein